MRSSSRKKRHHVWHFNTDCENFVRFFEFVTINDETFYTLSAIFRLITEKSVCHWGDEQSRKHKYIMHTTFWQKKSWTIDCRDDECQFSGLNECIMSVFLFDKWVMTSFPELNVDCVLVILYLLGCDVKPGISMHSWKKRSDTKRGPTESSQVFTHINPNLVCWKSNDIVAVRN